MNERFFEPSVEVEASPDEEKGRLEGIDFVFDQHPQLASIGNKEQYSEYLDALFPHTTVRKILYHEGNKGIDRFENTHKSSRGWERFGVGHYFADNKEYAQGFGEQMYSVLLDMQNPMKVTINGENYRDVARISNEQKEEMRAQGFDSLFAEVDPVVEREHPHAFHNEYVVFEPEQVRILGSKEDMEDFQRHLDALRVSD